MQGLVFNLQYHKKKEKINGQRNEYHANTNQKKGKCGYANVRHGKHQSKESY
jgi:hypothetical protein